MSGTSYTQKRIDITLSLGRGQFGDTGQSIVKLTGLRTLVNIAKGGFPSMDRAAIRVYGVPPSIMNEVSTLGIPLQMIRLGNTVTVEAGDAENGVSVVYSGYMHQCWQDFSEIPETSLMINGYGGMAAAIKPVPPISYTGSADVATIMSGLATTMGLAFENGGVITKLANPYIAGTALEQAHEVARQANIEMYVDTSSPSGTLAVWPKNGTRGGQIPLIAADSGLVGYPTFQSSGMSFRTPFNRNIQFAGKIQMQSKVGVAASPAPAGSPVPAGTQTGGPNGFWYVVSPLTHDLSSELPGGPWFTSVRCVRVPGQV